MPGKNIENIMACINELGRRAGEHQAFAKTNLNPLFEQANGEGRSPKDFIESSFLYIRSCIEDDGSRPISCSAFWLSPDLQVAPVSNLGMPTRTLMAGQTYRLACTVRNNGDLIVPSAKVEFFLSNPSLGFDTRYATKLGVVDGWVNPYSATTVYLPYLVPPDLSGHRCLFARVFAFSPLDIPLDDYALSPIPDRHVAQLNLDFLRQGDSFNFNWIHLPNAHEQIELIPMQDQTLRALNHELAAGMEVTGRAKFTKARSRVRFELERQEGQAIEARQVRGGFQLFSKDDAGFSLEKQANIREGLRDALVAIQKSRGAYNEFRALFREYRAMNKQALCTRMSLYLPDFSLKDNQAIPLNLIKRDLLSGEVTGGISLIVTA